MSQISLHLGDCLEVMRGMAAGSVDAVVTDPPWGLGFSYDGRKDVADNSPEVYWKWYEPIYQEMLRLLRPGGLMAFWQAHAYFRHLWNWYGEDIHIYCAAKNFAQIRKTLPFTYAYEPVVMFYKDGGPMLRPTEPRRNLNWSVGNTAGVISNTKRIEKGHPCPRPLDQLEEIVGNFAKDGATVLDPFMGSGTTGVACVKTGRNFIGIEIDEGYFNVAKRRIEEAAMQLPLLSVES